MKIKGVDFPKPLLNALRDGKLVVFAGAGVSMGPPAGLPSFSKLATQVAEGTGKSKESSETEDQFLGRLKDGGAKVHQRAADILQRNDPQPNSLHKDLLRLFREDQQVRIVTTNFDCLFEQVAETVDLFKTKVRVFQALALPLGSRFHGIVHLHGFVEEPEEMVLTHRDFGCAYLTEADGWARRFLLDLFSTYTVLFIGYSHSDTIMTYLTPSLPPDDKDKRFALVRREEKDKNHWKRMSIVPIFFPQKNENDFSHLRDAVEGLANLRRRGILGSQQEIVRIASGYPPKINDEDSGIIDDALKSVELIKFFVQAAKSSEWIDWLDQRGHLKPLFNEGELEAQGKPLAWWLAGYFTGANSDQLFSVISKYGGRLNPYFSTVLLLKLGDPKEKTLDSKTLSRWVPILMSCVPTSANEYWLLDLAKCCASIGEFQSLLQVYDVMTAKLIWFLPELDWGRNNPWTHPVEELRRECLKPKLPQIAHTLLERTTMGLEQRYSARIARDKDDHGIDYDSCRRSAIKSHQQDERLVGIDPLINIARDCLEWLAIHEPVTAGMWCNRFANAKAPLLRRLVIYATNTREDLSAQDKMAWLLEKNYVNDDEVDHEIFRITGDVYSQISQQQRQMLIQAISQYQIPVNICNDTVKRLKYQIKYQFDWFQWLDKADPNCSLVKAELDKIRAQYPKLQPSEHPDFTAWTEEGQLTGPWTVEELWDKPASEWLPNLLEYQSGKQEGFKAPPLTILNTVRDASEKNIAWGLDLADAMAAQSMWSCDLWECVIAGWAKGKLNPDTMGRVLSYLSANRLYPHNPGKIADVLGRLTEEINKDDATELLNKLNSIAINLYPHAVAVEFQKITTSPLKTLWLTRSISHPSGKLAIFWIKSIILWHKQQAAPPQALNAEYRRALDAIIDGDGIHGKLGRTVLASHFHVLYHVDHIWAEQHLLPLFDAQHEDFQCAWDGYLNWGRLSLPIAELLKDKFIGGLQRIVQDFSQETLERETLERFIDFYVLAMSRLIENAKDQWISEFFKNTRENAIAKDTFASAISRHLRDLDESSQKEWWNVWLKDYWSNRLQGVPCPLEGGEVAEMLQWVIHLHGVFPDAVAMAVKMEPVTLEDYSSLLREIAQSNLINRYPSELAQVLIYLGKADRLPWSWSQDLDVFHQLLEKDLPEELSKKLHEIVLRLQT